MDSWREPADAAGNGGRACMERGVYDMCRKKEEWKHEIKKRMRPVRCPKCGGRIMDARIDTKVQFIPPSTGHCPDFILKCNRCGAEIGTVKI